jgi:ABC-type multidrug transport system fused ATPase/permease subunit
LFILSYIANKYLNNILFNGGTSSFFNNISKCRNKINELFTNIKMIKSFAREKDEVKEYEKYFMQKTIFENHKYLILLEINSIITKLDYPILLIFVGKFILEGKCTLGIFTIFQQYKNEFEDCFNSIKVDFKSIKNKIETWKKFLELYDFRVKIKTLKNYIPKEIKGKINFGNVSFSYPLQPETNVLNNLTFNIESGKTLAICGFSGSGKTSISNLLERFYDVNKGNIYIDDADIRDYNIKYLRKNVIIVEQEPILNSGSILSNIVYGVDNYDEEKLKEVLKIACIDTFINNKALFPKG